MAWLSWPFNIIMACDRLSWMQRVTFKPGRKRVQRIDIAEMNPGCSQPHTASIFNSLHTRFTSATFHSRALAVDKLLNWQDMNRKIPWGLSPADSQSAIRGTWYVQLFHINQPMNALSYESRMFVMDIILVINYPRKESYQSQLQTQTIYSPYYQQYPW